MQFSRRTIGTTLILASLAGGTGCNNAGNGAATGAAVGGGFGAVAGAFIGHRNPLAGALIGGAIGVGAGAITGAIIGHINEQQQAQLQQQSPQTLEKIQHNDQVASASNNSPPPAQENPTAPTTPGGSSTPAAPAQPAPQPLTVDDVKAMSSAGIKSDVIVAEIGTSKSTFTQNDIASAQQAAPAIDPSVIDCMRKTMANS